MSFPTYLLIVSLKTTFIHRSSLIEEILPHKTALLATHGPSIMRAVLQGFAGVAPRSVVPNLIEMLGMLMNRSVGSGADGAAKWMQDILFSVRNTVNL